MQNTAARVLTNTSKFSHISPIIRGLHWLPIEKRIQFKIIIFVFKCLNNMAPFYLCNLIQLYVPSRNLRSVFSNKLRIPTIKGKAGEHSFYHAAPTLWNDLPTVLKNCKNYNTFKEKLKTHLFLS